MWGIGKREKFLKSESEGNGVMVESLVMRGGEGRDEGEWYGCESSHGVMVDI